MSYETMVQKGRFLRDAHERGWTIVLDHDPEHAVVKPVPNPNREGEFTLEPAG